MTGWPGPADETAEHVAADILATLERLVPGSGRLPDAPAVPPIPASLVRGLLDLLRLPEGARAAVTGPAGPYVLDVVGQELDGPVVAADGGGAAGGCTLVVLAVPSDAVGAVGGSGSHPLQPSIDEAARLLAPSGILLVLAEAPDGIARRLAGGGPRWSPAIDGGAPDGELARALEAGGLPAHERIVPFLDDPVALLLALDATTERAAPPPDLVAALRGDPLGSHPARPRFLGDPWAVADPDRDVEPLQRSIDTIVLVGARERAVLEQRLPGGGAWLVRHPAATSPAWRSTRRVEVAGDRWELRPIRPRPSTTGPYAVPDRGARVPPGRDGERLLAAALAEDGLDGRHTVELVTRWWASAARIIERAPAEERPVELPPRDFIVDAAGAWWPIGGGVVARVPVPETVVAFGGLLRTLEVAIRSRWVAPGDPDRTIGAAVAVLMAHVGLELTHSTRYLWAEVEADLRRRTGRSSEPHRELRARLVARTELPLAATIAELPLPARVRAVADIHAARREASLAARHETLRTELVALSSEIARRRDAVPPPSAAAPDST